MVYLSCPIQSTSVGHALARFAIGKREQIIVPGACMVVGQRGSQKVDVHVCLGIWCHGCGDHLLE